MNTKLKPEDVQFASEHVMDANGRVFIWDGGVYRAISRDMAPFYRQLLQSEAIDRLFRIGLIETEIAPLELDGYDIVLKHKWIPFTSFVTEWCGNMLKDAALLTLDLNLALGEMGLELQDAHPWNVLFDGCKPAFVDFSSIKPVQNKDTWGAFGEFIGKFYNPLKLMAEGLPSQARSLLVDSRTLHSRYVSSRDVQLTLLKYRKLRQFFGSLSSPAASLATERKAVMVQMRETISATQIPLETTSWSDYNSEEVDLSTLANWIPKRKSPYDAICRYRPETLLDIGSNTGWFSKLAALHGSKVVAFDVDETCVNKLYLNDRARELGILPLAMDFSRPIPRYGIGLHCAPAIERLRCDMVLGLAIVHHMVFKQELTFESIISNLAAFSKKYVLVEFIPREDIHVSKLNDDRFPWYTTDGFVKTLRQHFRKIEILPSNPEPRLMFLCER